MSPRLAKRDLTGALKNYGRLAEMNHAWGPLDPAPALLFRTLVGAAGGTLYQLFVENAHAELDWDLKRYRSRLSIESLTILVYWFTLFYIARFEEWGASGYDRAVVAPQLLQAAEQWITFISRGINIEKPVAWSSTWQTDSTSLSSKALHSETYKLLGIRARHSIGSMRGITFATLVVPDIYAARRQRLAERTS